MSNFKPAILKQLPREHDFIAPAERIALLIGIEDYSKSEEINFGTSEKEEKKKLENLKFPKADVQKMKALLKSFNFEVITNEKDDGHNSILELNSAAFFEEQIELLKKREKAAKAANKYMHFFVYFSGHGVTSSNTHKLCGIDGGGFPISLQYHAEFFGAKMSKSFSIFFFDCCRERMLSYPESRNEAGLFDKYYGISIMKVACNEGQKASEIHKYENSPITSNFINLFQMGGEDGEPVRYKKSLDVKEILDHSNHMRFAIEEYRWPNWLLFINQSPPPTIDAKVPPPKVEEKKEMNGGMSPDQTLEEGTTRYVGQIADGKKHGKGIQYFSDGDYKGGRFEGTWIDDKKNGVGIYFDLFGRKMFEGEFTDDLASGQGISYYKDNFTGTRVSYEGTWEDGQRNGKGIQYFQYGGTYPMYDGEFKNGLYHGFGKQFDSNGNYYRGIFLYGVRHGPGESFLSNGVKVFEGSYKHGLRNGQCKTYYSDGTLEFEGEFRNGLKWGRGKYIKFYTREIYEGTYFKGLLNGEGIVRFMDGSRVQCHFKNGRREGRAILYHLNGTVGAECIYNDDIMIYRGIHKQHFCAIF